MDALEEAKREIERARVDVFPEARDLAALLAIAHALVALVERLDGITTNWGTDEHPRMAVRVDDGIVR